MKLKIFRSVKSKLSFLISIVFGLISVFVYTYFPTKFAVEGFKALQREAHTIGNIASNNVGSGLLFNDFDVVHTGLEPLTKNKNITYIVIHDQNNSVFYSYNFDKAKISDYKTTSKVNENKKYECLKLSIPIVFNSEKVGNLFMGYSLENLHANVSSIKNRIAIISLVLFILSVVLVYFIGLISLRPLTKVAETAEKISSGELSIRAPVYTDDEVGNLAESFNVMVDKLFLTNEELETINKELENRVIERTKQLSESEERFRGLYENSSIGIYRASAKNEIILANPALLKMLGYDSLEEFVNSRIIGKGYFNKEQYKKFYEILEKENKIIGFEQFWKKKNGDLIFIRESVKAVYNENGKILYYDGTVEDITLKKEYEEKLINAKEVAEAAVKMKTEFLAQMSHEIRTPINSILSYTQLLKSEIIDLVPEELKFSFDMINNGGRRLIRTVDMILNMSELQTGTYEVILEEIDLVEGILAPLVGEFKTAAESKNLSIMLLNRLEKEQSGITIDIYTATQIFANLIDNAIKYTIEGSIEVVAYQNSFGQICVDIQDTGIGISKKFQESLFEPFTQEEQGYTRKFEGNGLGMALVKEYCNLNNVDIKIESEKDKGTLFTVTFKNQNIEQVKTSIVKEKKEVA